MNDVIQERIKSLEQRLATNPQTPLFVRLASCYLQVGRASEALRLCDDGLANYPFYSTAHLVKGKALVELGMSAEAKHEYEVVHELLPTNETVARLVSGIEDGSPSPYAPVQTVDDISEPEIVTSAPPMEEAVTEAAQPATSEESVQQELRVTEEDTFASETAPTPEIFAAQPETATSVETLPDAEEAFGFQTPLAVESVQVPPSGFETPGFGVEENPQPELQEDITAPAEVGTAPSHGIELPIESSNDYGFSVTEAAPSIEPVTQEAPFASERLEPSTVPAAEDAFGLPLEAPQAPTFVEPMPELQPPVVPAPSFPELAPVPEPPVSFTPPAPEPTSIEAPPGIADQTPEWFDAFAQLQQPTTESPEALPIAQAEEENPFAMFGTDQTSVAAEGEPYEDFAARARMELFGTEDTLTLDEYLGASAPAEPPPVPDEIGELAEKLKSSPRITPPVINYSEKASRPSTEGEVSSGSGFVTPTLAEIYVKQGWFDDAVKAYRALAVNKPSEKERFEQRIVEIEEMKRRSGK